MWVLKTQGETYYVNHVDCELPWSTKETPNNPHTKGSIKVKDCLLQVDESNCAKISKLTIHDEVRLRNQKLGITRVIVKEGQDNWRFREQIKSIGGACSSTFYITDILDKKHFTMLALAMSNTTFRVLMPNEGYYKVYDDPKYHAVNDIDLDAVDYDDED
jgi:hypothetical protein